MHPTAERLSVKVRDCLRRVIGNVIRLRSSVVAVHQPYLFVFKAKSAIAHEPSFVSREALSGNGART